MIKKISFGIGLVLALILIYVGLKPSDYFIKREIVISKKADAIFPYLSNMRKADEWMPWKESDPQVKNTYLGPEEGIGAISSWESPGQMGVGQAEVIAMVSNEKVTTKITYTKPMTMEQIAEFIVTQDGESSRVAWTVSGKNNFISKLICTLSFTNIDKYVGGEFEKGLKKLKTIVEGN